MGMVIFKSGGMMFKHKNKFFPFQKHYLFIFNFFFFGVVVVELVDAPRSWLCPGSLWPHQIGRVAPQQQVYLRNGLPLAPSFLDTFHVAGTHGDPQDPWNPQRPRPLLLKQARSGRERANHVGG